MHAVPLSTLRAATFGAADIEQREDGFMPRRLPRSTRIQYADAGVDWISSHTAGVRLRLNTAARRLRVRATFIRNVDSDAPAPPFPVTVVATTDGVVVDRCDLDDGTLIVAAPDRTSTVLPGEVSVVDLHLGGDGSEREVQIWLPHTAQVIVHGAEADAPAEASAASDRPVWLHHGSSISHGLEADGPLGPWPQQAAAALGVELLNLGFAGNALLDPFVARTIAAADADVITLKLGINVVNADAMRERTFVPALHGFLDIVQDGHPHTPVAVITAISCPSHEHTPGPTRRLESGRFAATPRQVNPGDGTLTLQRTRELVGHVVTQRAAEDPQLRLVDGLELFGPDDAALLYDDLHPNQDGYDLIAARFTGLARTLDHPLGRTFASVLAGTTVREGEGARRLPTPPGLDPAVPR
ncbi:GDSL-type esterase/lipase family protein [Microbacterium dauci]|uniref:SGNH/GDSL hydrolase family protein n=1 Tax=Microbacterium dauci TaxID=3048008 RepID=A0ABT6ZCC6_9MICO|nr:GDSL-type esterase/lipase family protein [Microbacterium sp. LX3-4]MDJ1113816.1 SGNH/GDSL hydrolase family protein [Microbacterium sp. LX3-4]